MNYDLIFLFLFIAMFTVPVLGVMSQQTFKNIKKNRKMGARYKAQRLKFSPSKCPRCGRPLFPGPRIVAEGIPFYFIRDKYIEIEKHCPKPVYDGVDSSIQLSGGCGWEAKLVFPWNGFSWDESDARGPEPEPPRNNFNRVKAVRRGA